MQSIENCHSGHKLIFSNVSAINDPSETYYCNYCGTQCAVSSGRWVCNPCVYSICSACKKPPFKSTNCLNNHALQWSTNVNYAMPGASGALFQCKNCLGSHNCTEGRWNCAYCSFDICSSCKKPPYTSSTCPSGHALAWNTAGYTSGAFSCNQCKTTFPTANGRWFCQDCQFDICSSCKIGGGPSHMALPDGAPRPTTMSAPMPPPMPAPPMSIPPPMSMPAPMPYPPTYSMPPMGYGVPPPAPYGIVTAPSGYGYSQPVMYGRPVQYTYQTVPTTVHLPPAPINPTPGPLKCPSGHGLLFSKSATGYYNSTFKCNKCFNQYPCSVGRWNCSTCKFDICKLCRPS